METGAVCGNLQLPPFLVGSCEEYFEGGPDFLCRVLAETNLAVVKELASLKYELVGDGDNLLGSVQSLALCRMFDSIFDLIR